MKTIYSKPFALLLAFALFGISNYVFGEDKYETLEINPGPFTHVVFDGAYDVELVQGNQESITIYAEKSDLDEIKTEIENGKLRLYTKDNVTLSKFKVMLKFKTLESIEFNGGMKLRGKHDLKFVDLLLKINGGADLNLKLTADKLNIELSGGTNGDIKGSVNSLDILLNGAGRIVTDELTAKDVKVHINGAGYASIFASNSVDASIAGVGSIEYFGNPAKVKSNIIGLGAIKEKGKEK
jgi:hypothetical protein